MMPSCVHDGDTVMFNAQS